MCVCVHSHACERTQERWTSEAEKGEKRRKVEMSRYCSQGCKGRKRKNERSRMGSEEILLKVSVKERDRQSDKDTERR